MIANLDLYWESWHNRQVPTNIAGFNLTGNAGNARIRGIAGQLQTLLPEGFDLSLNAAYTDAVFVESSASAGIPAGTSVPDIRHGIRSLALERLPPRRPVHVRLTGGGLCQRDSQRACEPSGDSHAAEL